MKKKLSLPNIEHLMITTDEDIRDKIRRSYDFSATVIWLIDRFINKERQSITVKEYRTAFKKGADRAYHLLESFVTLGLLKKTTTTKPKRYLYRPVYNKNKLLLLKFLEDAKKVVRTK